WPDTIQAWDQMQTEAEAAGQKADPFLVRQFDKNVRAGTLLGFFRSANSYAALIALCALTTAGLSLQRLRDRDDPGFALVLGLPALASLGLIYLTGSRTAIAGLLLWAIAIAIGWFNRKGFRQRAGALFVIGAACVVAIAGTVVAIGISTGGLLHNSLTFRWNYWAGSWSLFKAHPITGVGWSNFGNSYLAHRLPMAAEEIKDPHNFVVKFLAETGIVGAVLVLAWFARTAWEATRPIEPRETSSAVPAGGSSLRLIAGIAISFAILRTIVLQPLSLLFPEPVKIVLYAILLSFGLLAASVRAARATGADDRAAPLLLLAAIVAIGGFWLHAMVDFALFETGPLLVMMVLLGAVLGVRHPGAAGRVSRTKIAIAALCAVSLGLMTFIALVVVPLASAERHAGAAMEMATRKLYSSAADELRQAYITSPVSNQDYASRASWMMAMSGTSKPDDVVGMLTLAINADPAFGQLWLDRGRYLARMENSADAAIADFQRYLSRNPADIGARLELADFLTASNKPREAAAEYRRALDFNSKLDDAEPRRLSPDRVREIDAKIARLPAG
ncbi:MAG: O-antigen ligase family protein, partial [Burkholderiales bacterium]|nr:O-antigen ligase family protein [Phycisphaerae bacterium]